MNSLCQVEECGRPTRSRGLCGRHYEHARVYGTPDGPTTAERFWSKVNKSQGCWLWTAAVNARGYGKFKAERYEYAHRYAYRLMVGPIPPDMTLDHLCRTPLCVNPAHLEVVTALENRLRASRAITHCPHGHQYTAENTATGSRGERRCRECNRIRNRKYRRES